MSVDPRIAFWRAISAVLALFLGLTMLLNFSREATSAPSDGGPEVSTVVVTLTEFGIEPSTIELAAGRPAELVVTNAGGIDHDLRIEGVAATPMLQPGASATLQVPALDEGVYEAICTVPGHLDAGMTATVVVSSDGGGGRGGHGEAEPLTPEEMAALHDEGVAAFPAETEGRGGVPLEPSIDEDGVKVFELTASEIEWEVEPGVWRSAMAYNEQVPGPRIDVDLGDEVRVVFHNELSVPSAVHFHGLVLPFAMDGVPGLTQPSVLPGETFVYEFPVRNAGSHMYHSHFDSAHQVTMGLLGAFIVHAPDDQPVDLDYVMVLGDGPLGYHINGKGFPATEPLVVGLGDTIRVRYMNEGLQIHPMHLHGTPQTLVARDGYPIPQPYQLDTVLVAPGERIDVIIEATEPGPWAFHCHVLSHAEGPHGMFGMVTALIVDS